ncbi:MAG: hypothetical protein H7039_05875 [Bryobacteraceae bacterium]|nr:hypothetical protein [Bryobacteraceae bacterium]
MSSPQTPSPQPPVVYSELDVKLPIAMLPVRLETRYFDIDANTVELRIRIFPSPAHVTSARSGIDPAEREETITYWRTRKAAGDTAPPTDAAWQRMVQMFGEPRASYLRRILTPTTDAAGALVFPEVPLNPPPETSSALASEAIGLPSRFFAALYMGTSRQLLVAGQKVPASVAVGPHGDPNAIRWQSDFATAESIGLGIRVRANIGTARYLTRLLVFGVREGSDAASSQSALQTLLERHSREDGVALLAAGTPTNNTPAARVSPPSPATGVAPARSSDGGRLATALGMDATAFANVSGTTAATDQVVEAINTALWPATFGYFFEPLMSPLVNEAAVARGRTLFQKFVRPRGPFQTLALGGQPYGILPVSSLERWKTPQGTLDPVANVLSRLRTNLWMWQTNAVPRLGRSADTGSDLNAVLSQSPVSTRWIARTLQTSYVTLFMMLPDLLKFFAAVRQLRDWRTTGELTPLGLSGEPLALDVIFDEKGFLLNVPLVAASEAPRNAPLPVNYIDSIAAAEVDLLKAHNVAGSSPKSLLYLLLRHATLLVMGRAANRFLSSGSPNVQEPVIIEDPATTVWARLNTPVAALENRTLTEVFKGPLPSHPNLTELAQHKIAVKSLSRLPISELERLTAETLDASSHRLDAWITALATERLASMRAVTPRGSHVGAYAWLDGLSFPAVLSKDGAPAIADPDSEGFIHGPGLEHARTAAILRAGYVARNQEGAQAPLAIDLSSDRVRDARSLLEAVRNGANLAALLGERIERWMVELGLGTQLPDVRTQFALVDGSGRKRINGLKAAQAWNQSPPSNLPAVASRLASVTDAIGDLLLAEAVHQQSTGNPGRAQPALAALDTGLTLPPEFDVVRTESNSTSSTWRLVLPLAQDARNAWIAGIIGNPANLAATVTGTGKPPVTVTLAQIGVSATGLLDFVKAGVEASALSNKFSESAGGGSVSYSPALQTALRAASAISRLLTGARAIQEGDVGPKRDLLPLFDRRSARKEWLHDFARVRPSIEALDSLEFILRGAGKDLPLRFVSADTASNVVSIGDLPTGPVSGLLIDGWNETTPGKDATTGIAMHYDAPRSRAPQAILLITPPEVTGWNIDSVESALVETWQLSQMRMIRPADVHGSFLPALYFADNYAGDTVATNFSTLGTVAQHRSS